jgi:DNA-binding transcriptional MerR regulator
VVNVVATTRCGAHTDAVDGAQEAASGVGVAAAARRVGVAAATLRAWERRYGLGPSGHTPGGHRRYSGADITTLSRLRRMVEAGMPTASAAALTQASPLNLPAARNGRDHRDGDLELYAGLAAAADSLAAAELARVARSVLAQRGVVAAWTQVFAPHLQALGRQWSATGQGIECEHLTVAVLQSVLRKGALRRRARGAGPSVLLAAVPGEAHTLPLDALAAALAETGRASYVVYDLPPPALRRALERSAAGPVVVWARGSAHRGVTMLRVLHGAGSPLYAAGPGWRVDRLPGGVDHLPDLPAAVDALCRRGHG